MDAAAPTQQVMVDAQRAGIRLDLFLTDYLNASAKPGEQFSRAQIQRLIDGGQVTLNGAETKSSARVKTNDQINIERLEPRDVEVESEDLPLTVVHEDADCIVLNKPPGITVHPAAGRWGGTLVNALLHHCPDIGTVGGVRRPGIVHRLDRDTSGVMIAAKNEAAYHALVRQFKERRVEKEYIGVVRGRMLTKHGVIDGPIGRHRSDRKRMSSVYFLKPARPAVTCWAVEEPFRLGSGCKPSGFATLLRLWPRTGRTHQIRVHLADQGHSLIGDPVYGKRREFSQAPETVLIDSFPRQALHSEKLAIDHPRTGRRLEFVAGLPDDIQELLNSLRRASRTGVGQDAGVDKGRTFK